MISLDTVATVERQVAFYVDQHNRVLLHSAFKGQTPDEMYFGTGVDVPDKLKAARQEAREPRRKFNLATPRCSSCQPKQELITLKPPPTTST